MSYLDRIEIVLGLLLFRQPTTNGEDNDPGCTSGINTTPAILMMRDMLVAALRPASLVVEDILRSSPCVVQYHQRQQQLGGDRGDSASDVSHISTLLSSSQITQMVSLCGKPALSYPPSTLSAQLVPSFSTSSTPRCTASTLFSVPMSCGHLPQQQETYYSRSHDAIELTFFFAALFGVQFLDLLGEISGELHYKCCRAALSGLAFSGEADLAHRLVQSIAAGEENRDERKFNNDLLSEGSCRTHGWAPINCAARFSPQILRFYLTKLQGGDCDLGEFGSGDIITSTTPSQVVFQPFGATPLDLLLQLWTESSSGCTAEGRLRRHIIDCIQTMHTDLHSASIFSAETIKKIAQLPPGERDPPPRASPSPSPSLPDEWESQKHELLCVVLEGEEMMVPLNLSDDDNIGVAVNAAKYQENRTIVQAALESSKRAGCPTTIITLLKWWVPQRKHNLQREDMEEKAHDDEEQMLSRVSTETTTSSVSSSPSAANRQRSSSLGAVINRHLYESLRFAVQDERLEDVKRLLKAGAPLSPPSSSLSPRQQQQGHSQPPTSPQQQLRNERQGHTLLMLAAERGNLKMLQELVNRAKEIESQSNRRGCEEGEDDNEGIFSLRQWVLAQSEKGSVALHLALENIGASSPHVIDFLLSEDLSGGIEAAKVPNRYGKTPLDIVEEYLLLAAGTNVRSRRRDNGPNNSSAPRVEDWRKWKAIMLAV